MTEPRLVAPVSSPEATAKPLLSASPDPCNPALGPSTSLLLPLANRAGAWLAALAVWLVYLGTCSRDLSLYDSAELALVARQLGLGHPLGQPLHTLLGYLASRFPGVSPLLGINLLSATAAALSVLPAVSLAESMLRDRAGAGAENGRNGKWSERVLVPLLVAAVALHPTPWESASRVEVYALANFFALLAAARLAAALRRPQVAPRDLLVVGILLGLSACANPLLALVTALASTPALLGVLLGRHLCGRRLLGRSFDQPVLGQHLRPAALLAAIGGGLLGLTPYLYILLVAHRDDAAWWFTWGAPRTPEALLRFLGNADFTPNVQAGAAEIAAHMADWVGWAAGAGVLLMVVVGLAGHIVLGAGGLGRWFAPLLLLFALGFVASNVGWLLDNPDYQGYLALPFAVAGAGAAAAVAAVLRAASSRGPRFRLYAAALAVILLADIGLSPPRLFARTRQQDLVARRLAEGVLDEAPAGTILVVDSDHFVFPLLYLQEAEGRRPDVAVMAYGLASSSWYWEHLWRRHPDLRPVELRGPGGKAGRVQRFLAANQPRPIHFERLGLARMFAGRVCLAGWMLRAGTDCDRRQTRPGRLPAQVLADLLRQVQAGSPGADAAIALVALDQGEALWRLGHGAAALETLLAGVPPRLRPSPTRLAAATLDATLPLRAPLPRWRVRVALGSPGRNLFVVAMLLAAAGDRAAAERHLRAAAETGLPEALTQ